MRIVDVNPYFYPWPGGIEHRMHRLAKELVKRGHEVIIVTGRLPDTKEDEVTEFGYRVVRLPSKYYNIYQPPYISSKAKYLPCQCAGKIPTGKLHRVALHLRSYWAMSYMRCIFASGMRT